MKLEIMGDNGKTLEMMENDANGNAGNDGAERWNFGNGNNGTERLNFGNDGKLWKCK